ncbi:MAG: hypothetical protein HOP01_02250 [Gallionella sp.]|nr:hypothetical protein [Gallionella sp.]
MDLSVLVGARCVAATAFCIRVLGGALAHDWSTGQHGVTALPCPGCDTSPSADRPTATHRGLTGVGFWHHGSM